MHFFSQGNYYTESDPRFDGGLTTLNENLTVDLPCDVSFPKAFDDSNGEDDFPVEVVLN